MAVGAGDHQGDATIANVGKKTVGRRVFSGDSAGSRRNSVTGEVPDDVVAIRRNTLAPRVGYGDNFYQIGALQQGKRLTEGARRRRAGVPGDEYVGEGRR